MRVIIVDPSCFSPPYDHCLSQALLKAGCDVTLARSPFEEIAWATGTYKVWEGFYPITSRLKMRRGKLRTAIKGVDHILSMRRFARMAKQRKPDVIHFEWLPLPGVDLRFLPTLRQVAPLVLTVHDTKPFMGSPSSRLQRVGTESALTRFDALIVHTGYSRKQLLERGLDPAKVHVIPHGAFDYYNALRRPGSRPEPEAPRTLLFFGSIKPYKGLDLLLDAFAAMRSDLRASARLLIAGTPGMEIEPLQRQAEQLGIAQQVQWRLGYIDEATVPELFDQSLALVMPYRDIDQSGVLLAAVGLRKPIIATTVGGIPETMEDPAHGLLVPANDVGALAHAMERMLSDPGLPAQMTANLDQLARTRYSWDAIAGLTLQVYNLIAAQNSVPRSAERA